MGAGVCQEDHFPDAGVFQPGQIESIVLLARDQVDHAVRRLTDRQIAARFGRVGAHGEIPGVAAAIDRARRAVVADQPLYGPFAAVVVRQSGEQPRDGTLRARSAGNGHVLAKRAERDRPFLQPQDRQPLATAQARKRTGRVGPRLAQIVGHDRMNGAFIEIVGLAAHAKAARLDADEFHAQRILEHLWGRRGIGRRQGGRPGEAQQPA